MTAETSSKELADDLARLNAYHSEQFARNLMKIKPAKKEAAAASAAGAAKTVPSIMSHGAGSAANSNSVASLNDSQRAELGYADAGGVDQKYLAMAGGRSVKVKRKSVDSNLDNWRRSLQKEIDAQVRERLAQDERRKLESNAADAMTLAALEQNALYRRRHPDVAGAATGRKSDGANEVDDEQQHRGRPAKYRYTRHPQHYHPYQQPLRTSNDVSDLRPEAHTADSNIGETERPDNATDATIDPNNNNSKRATTAAAASPAPYHQNSYKAHLYYNNRKHQQNSSQQYSGYPQHTSPAGNPYNFYQNSFAFFNSAPSNEVGALGEDGYPYALTSERQRAAAIRRLMTAAEGIGSRNDLGMNPYSHHYFPQGGRYSMAGHYGDSVFSLSKVSQSRAALVRERQKLLEQTEKYQRQLILKQNNNVAPSAPFLNGSGEAMPSKQFLEKLNNFGALKHPGLTINLGILSPNISTKPLHTLGNGLLGDSSFRPYTKHYITEVIKRSNIPKRPESLDTVDECFSGEYLDDHSIAISYDGPFWPIGINPHAALPDALSQYDNTPSAEPYQQAYFTENAETGDTKLCADSHAYQSDEYEYWKSGRHNVYDMDKHQAVPKNLPVDDALVFESRFESGNLRQVKRVGPAAYELVLSTDRFTQRHTQWFYFSISNVRKRNYKFFIINLHKKDSLYNYGMQPVVFYQGKWQRFGRAIKYCPYSPASLYGAPYATCHNQNLPMDKNYYALVLELGPFGGKPGHKLPQPNERIFISHCYPYTYTNLRRHVQALSKRPQISDILRVETLCRTITGNNCYILTITNFKDSDPPDNLSAPSALNDYYTPADHRKMVIVTARVHPGESQASWMAHGLIRFLLTNNPDAVKLRNMFVFKIVPMINIDGVVVGNYRTSLAAKDLNRNYRFPRQDVFPVIWYIKEVIRQSKRAGRTVQFYVDLHGHSRKKSSFMYGCAENMSMHTDGSETLEEFQERRLNHMLEQRMLPWLMGQRAKNLFNFDYCAFSMRKSKESTGRVVMYKEFGIKNSFTLEATFAGHLATTPFGEAVKNPRQFSQKDFMDIGKHLAETFLDYELANNEIEKRNSVLEQIALRLRWQIAGRPVIEEKSEATNRHEVRISEVYSPVTDAVLSLARPGLRYDSVHSNSSNSLNRCLSILGQDLDDIFDDTAASGDEGKGKSKSKKSAKKKSMSKLFGDSDDGDDSDSESDPELIITVDEFGKKKATKPKKAKKKKKKRKEEAKPEEKPQKEAKSEPKKKDPDWDNPYANRSGRGQGDFTAERSKKKDRETKSAVDTGYQVNQPSHSIYHPSQYRPTVSQEQILQNEPAVEHKVLEMNQFRFPGVAQKKMGDNSKNLGYTYNRTRDKNQISPLYSNARGNSSSALLDEATSGAFQSTNRAAGMNFYPRMFKGTLPQKLTGKKVSKTISTEDVLDFLG